MRVIALTHFTDREGEFHPYGHEFTLGDDRAAERAELLAKHTIRVDDRSARSPGSSASQGAAVDGASDAR